MTISAELGSLLKQHTLSIATAESCTAGMISSTIADTPGSSQWLDSGYVVYTPQAKNEILGVHYKTIETFDITSCEVAIEMAKGVLRNRPSTNIIIATTGLAGPDGGTPEIPNGTVCFGWLYNIDGKTTILSESRRFSGTRQEVREQATNYALSKTISYIREIFPTYASPTI